MPVGPTCGPLEGRGGALLIDNGIDRIDWIDSRDRLVGINAVGQRALGLSDAQCRAGLDWPGLWLPDHRLAVADHVRRARAGDASRFTAASGSADNPVWWDVVVSRVTGRGLVAQARDVTLARAVEEGFRQRARHDDLTGLLNRSAFKEELAIEIARHEAAGGNGMVLMLDLDNFKFINDTMGHDSGDRVLQHVATALRAVTVAGDRLARLGGDEFAILLRNVGDHDGLRDRAEAIMTHLNQPLQLASRSLSIRTSIGAVAFPKHGNSAVDLLKKADIALYAAKAFGRRGYVLFVPSMAGPLRRRAAATTVIRDALANNRVDAFYQPMIDLASGRLHGFEAKLQVFQASGRTLPATELLAVQEDVDLAETLGQRILSRVMADARRWQSSGLAVTRIAINVAAAEFRSGDYAERFLRQLAAAGLPPGLFEIEVAQTVFAGRGTDYVASALATLNAAGVRISLDAFGTGPGTLSNLKHLPVSGIKIDGAFVEAVEHDAADSAMVRAIIGIATGFGLGLGAEGISTPGQARLLRALGCDIGQGALFGAAGSFDSVLPLLRDCRPAAAIASDADYNRSQETGRMLP